MAAEYVPDEATLDDLIASQSLVVVDCTASWCGPCKLVAPLMDQLASEYGEQATVVKLDIDSNKVFAKRFGIKSIPAVLFFKQG
ncbi:MAG: thioredoxin family protein, partial [Cyanobacteria bacterium P01_H01_bin.105]